MPRDQRAQLRIAQHDPPARRHAVGHVHELLRGHPIEVAEHGLLEQLRVQRRDPVDRVAADARQVRHAHALVPGLVDDREPPRQLIVAGMTLPHVIEEATVDLVNDLEMAWQHHAEQRQRPFFERFGKQGVVRVAARPFRDAPCGIPVQLVLVHEQPHQLGDRDRRVRVVQLCGPAGVELVERLPAQQVQPDHVLEGARHEKVLLLEAELLAGLRLVVRVEHLRDRLGRDFLGDRAVVVPEVERVQIERLGRFGLPQPQHVRRSGPVPGHRRVTRDPFHHPLGEPARAIPARCRRSTLPCARRTSRRRSLPSARSPRDCRIAATCR